MKRDQPGEISVRRLERRPDLVEIHRHWPEAWPYLLGSTASGRGLARWSLLLHATGEPVSFPPGPPGIPGFFDFLRTTSEASLREPLSDLPFCGGWFVYLGYELAAEIEPGLSLPTATDGLPIALAHRCPAALLVDHVKGDSWLVGEAGLDLDRLADMLAAAQPEPAEPLPPLHIEADAGERFIDGVDRIREYILAGDVFQVNLSRGWRANADQPIDPVSVFCSLAESNPAPFAGLARLPGGTVISSSPERLVEVRGRAVQTRPIAGTRPRGRSADDDACLSRELVAHPKERAEHIMLIDLERNDLGRVCHPGSVEVDELMVIESYAHVHHIVSNVRGRLRDGVGASEVIAAVFPGGTITGCPKFRCMQIIAELEGVGRGFYTGAMGYLGNDGSLDLNILIRSMCVSDDRISFRTGAGIVADSDPHAELAETEDKARGLLTALGGGP